ncbi:hypothetical protein E2C01_048840 [Portunus trituberculatus]|uniref:Uncharacterized protein n=1 Tax=Portunus trituberculatus TaxID=210409 RepID=A0A5B7G4S0_PORTR|nr:hypothetical protein [Portunus trituberculatus]
MNRDTRNTEKKAMFRNKSMFLVEELLRKVRLYNGSDSDDDTYGSDCRGNDDDDDDDDDDASGRE